MAVGSSALLLQGQVQCCDEGYLVSWQLVSSSPQEGELAPALSLDVHTDSCHLQAFALAPVL